MNDEYFPLEMKKPVGQFLGQMTKLELDRFISTLDSHLATKAGQDDLIVAQLRELAEFEKLNRD